MKELMAVVLASLGFAGAAQAQVPVTITSQLTDSPMTIAEFTENVTRWQQQYEQMVTQIDQLKRQYDALVGTYGRGRIGLQDAIDAVSVVPGSWQDIVSMQKKGVFATGQGYYEALLQSLPADVFANPQWRDARTYKMSSDSVRGAMAAGEALYHAIQVNVQNLSTLGRQVDSTVNLKDAQDLQNRIATESGMLQTSVARLSALNVNLQANLLNSENQALAISQKHFKWTKEQP
jgi:type IV secretion system protein VirB5